MSAVDADASPRLRSAPCRWQFYCAESLAELAACAFLIAAVYVLSASEDSSSSFYYTQQTLQNLYIASVISALKYAIMRLAPLVYGEGVRNLLTDFGSPRVEWEMVASQRKQFLAKAWCTPFAAVETAVLCCMVLLLSDVKGLALLQISSMLFINACIALESGAAAVLSHRRSLREVFPQGEAIQPSRYIDLVSKLPRCRSEQLQCAICLGDFVAQDVAVQLPCDHIFHADCAGEWMCRGNGCPYRCRPSGSPWGAEKDAGMLGGRSERGTEEL
mmetsp:Transcript_92351/g.197880  ORF Transcript_92351/g.197880 Transcript_92351/m.197880 type:complete len:274 (+) Transcript_92351:112-933(+)